MLTEDLAGNVGFVIPFWVVNCGELANVMVCPHGEPSLRCINLQPMHFNTSYVIMVPSPFNIPNLFLNELLFMWPVNKFEFIWPESLKKRRCLRPKDRMLVSIGCKFIRTFKCKNSKRRELQTTQMNSCQRKSIWKKHAWLIQHIENRTWGDGKNMHDCSHLNNTAQCYTTRKKRELGACPSHPHCHETSTFTSVQWRLLVTLISISKDEHKHHWGDTVQGLMGQSTMNPYDE